MAGGGGGGREKFWRRFMNIGGGGGGGIPIIIKPGWNTGVGGGGGICMGAPAGTMGTMPLKSSGFPTATAGLRDEEEISPAPQAVWPGGSIVGGEGGIST